MKSLLIIAVTATVTFFATSAYEHNKIPHLTKTNVDRVLELVDVVVDGVHGMIYN